MALPFEGRIVGGYPASRGQFPHQVSIQSNGQHSCGGSIIAADTILTAGHCISGDIYSATIVAGIIGLNEGGQRKRVVSASVHPAYDPQVIANDVAVLRLDSPFNLQPGEVEIISLRQRDVSPGETLTLSGWGLTSSPPGGQIPNALQCIQLGAIDLYTCAQQLQGIGQVNTGNVCTSSPAGQGACHGDSGGPLIDQSGQQIGVVSWGYPCAKGFPDVFTSVPFFLSWISQHV
jgi:trypsin